MRSDVKYLAKCGKQSLYFCRTQKETCPKLWDGCIYALKTLTKRGERNKIHPIAIDLSGLFVSALMAGLSNTAWCIDLAKTAIAWELIAKAEGRPELFVQNKIRDKIRKDKGLVII